MTIRSKALTFLAAWSLGGLLAQAAPNPNHTRYSVNEAFTRTGLDANASGRVLPLVHQNGQVSHQRLRVALSHLEPRTRYTLLAGLGDDTNLIAVADFTTTALGRSAVTVARNVSGHRARRTTGARTLPETLNPLTSVRTLAVANANGELVLTVDLHAADSLRFDLSRVLVNTGNDPAAVGCVALSCRNGNVQFRLLAAGQSSQYTLCVNDSPVGTYAADFTGRINVGTLPRTAPSPLLFQKLDVRNAGNEIVLEGDVQ